MRLQGSSALNLTEESAEVLLHLYLAPQTACNKVCRRRQLFLLNCSVATATAGLFPPTFGDNNGAGIPLADQSDPPSCLSPFLQQLLCTPCFNSCSINIINIIDSFCHRKSLYCPFRTVLVPCITSTNYCLGSHLFAQPVSSSSFAPWRGESATSMFLRIGVLVTTIGS